MRNGILKIQKECSMIQNNSYIIRKSYQIKHMILVEQMIILKLQRMMVNSIVNHIHIHFGQKTHLLVLNQH